MSGDAAGSPATGGALSAPDPKPDWSDAERWAWDRIVAGEIADFHARNSTPDLDPRKDGDARWNEPSRTVRPAFLVDLLTRAPWRDAVPYQGVRVVGGLIAGHLDLAHARISRQLWLDKCVVRGELRNSDLRVDGWLSFEGSKVAGAVDLARVHVAGMNLQSAHFDAAVKLDYAHIEGHLSLSSSTFRADSSFRFMSVDGNVILSSARFAKRLFLDDAEVKGGIFADSGMVLAAGLSLQSAKVGRHVSLDGVRCRGDLTLTGLNTGDLFIRSKAYVRGDVNFSWARLGGVVEIRELRIHGGFNASSARIGHDLFMSEVTFRGEVDLRNATVEGSANLTKSTFAGRTSLRAARVGGSLSLSEARFAAELNISLVKVGRTAQFVGTRFRGSVDASEIEVGGDMHLSRGARAYRDVDLLRARIGDHLSLDNAVFLGRLRLESVRVGGNLYARNAIFARSINAIFASVDRTFDLSDSRFRAIEGGTSHTVPPLHTPLALDLSAARVTAELRLGSSVHRSPRWRDHAHLCLRGARAGVVQDRRDSWPPTLTLSGFTYDRLGGFAAEGSQADPTQRDSGWFVNWLARDTAYSPQPYVHLANVLRANGEPGKANDVLFAGRQRARDEARRRGLWGRWVGLSLLRYIIGYGIGRGYWNVVVWVLLLAAAGAVVLSFSPAAAAKGWPWIFGASLDFLLPIVELNKEFGAFFDGSTRADGTSTKNLNGWQLLYFSVHSVFGYILGLFVVAGMAGLTQKP